MNDTSSNARAADGGGGGGGSRDDTEKVGGHRMAIIVFVAAVVAAVTATMVAVVPVRQSSTVGMTAEEAGGAMGGGGFFVIPRQHPQLASMKKRMIAVVSISGVSHTDKMIEQSRQDHAFFGGATKGTSNEAFALTVKLTGDQGAVTKKKVRIARTRRAPEALQWSHSHVPMFLLSLSLACLSLNI